MASIYGSHIINGAGPYLADLARATIARNIIS